MGNIRPFQIVLVAVFVLLAIVSIYLLRVYKPAVSIGTTLYGDQVIVWGSMDQNLFKNIQNEILDSDKDFRSIQYYYVDERSFDEELVNAIAEGRSPDLVILRSDALVKHRAKLLPVSYDKNGIPLRDFKDRYVDAAEIFALPDGIYAIPFLVDPLVMYWNRDLLATGGFAVPPTSWENVVNAMVPTLSIVDTNRTLRQSAIAFGEYRNVKNAKAMLLTLALQSGSQMTAVTDRGYDVKLDTPQTDDARPPLTAGVEFYTSFSNANSPLYSWNRAQAIDENAFVAEDLALYFGLGSEVQTIAKKNPNLNFDIAAMPQGAGATVKRTYGDVYGLAVPRGSSNPQGAYAAAITMSSPTNSKLFAEALGMSSAQRSVIAAGESDPYRQVIALSALNVRSWLDPDAGASGPIFQSMIEDVVSNRTRVSNAVSDAIRKLSFEY